jgi:hypothetical protein
MILKQRFIYVALTVLLSFLSISAFSQTETKSEKIDSSLYKVAVVAFYNLENIFDTIDDPDVRDEEFLPNGGNLWETQKYNMKLEHMSRVISQLGDDYVKGGPMICGICEIENKGVTQDLINTKHLKKSNYDFVQYEGPYSRGVDVALIYRKDYFQVTGSRAVTLNLPDNYKTRDILVVSGLLEGEPIHVLVNHWPSRGGGDKSVIGRNLAGQLARTLIDSIIKTDANAKIILMGDLNDDPYNESVEKYLNANGKMEKLEAGQLYNTMAPILKRGIGSLAYQDNWNLFDQIIVSQPLLGTDKSNFKFHSATVYNKNFLIQKDGRFAGYPFRTFSGGAYTNGYSDHFPTFIYLVRELKPEEKKK